MKNKCFAFCGRKPLEFAIRGKMYLDYSEITNNYQLSQTVCMLTLLNHDHKFMW